MRFPAFLLILSLFLTISNFAMAGSGPKPWIWSWWPWHWNNLDFERRYLEDPVTPHNSQWENDTWEPADWLDENSNARLTLDKLYWAGIITDQYTDDDIPVLEVGHNFVRLSGQEKRRVVEFVDNVFGITRSAENGMFYVYYDRTDEPIGIYTKDGLQLQ